MGRSKITQQLNEKVWRNTNKIGVFRCPEVTIYNERVDFLTYTKRNSTWRFYEVKSSKEDFYSPAKWTFLGHYNYFVMNDALFKEVKEDIPDHVGVTNGYSSLKRAKKQELGVGEEYLMMCFTRSLATQLDKEIDNNKRLKMELETTVGGKWV